MYVGVYRGLDSPERSSVKDDCLQIMSANADPLAVPAKLSTWRQVVEWLEAFPTPLVTLDHEGIPVTPGWMFRGARRSSYLLEPKIERIDTTMEWAAREVLIESEFRARAHLHLPPHLLPQDSLSWLAMMQHWGIPTRLLDFTHSPFVALYFAVRDGDHEEDTFRIWAIDTEDVSARFKDAAWSARRKEFEREQKRQGVTAEPPRAVSLHPDSYGTAPDFMKSQVEETRSLINEALAAVGTRRAEQARSGCVCVASPPSFNPRLASQQGVFLVNCTEDLTLRQSLMRMMGDKPGWCVMADINVGAADEIEERLFQMNIHEQSLFPDMEGLAGFIRQRTRLHWK